MKHKIARFFVAALLIGSTSGSASAQVHDYGTCISYMENAVWECIYLYNHDQNDCDDIMDYGRASCEMQYPH